MCGGCMVTIHPSIHAASGSGGCCGGRCLRCGRRSRRSGTQALVATLRIIIIIIVIIIIIISSSSSSGRRTGSERVLLLLKSRVH
jgi:hypothetical protein